jgi:hypothetical protein
MTINFIYIYYLNTINHFYNKLIDIKEIFELNIFRKNEKWQLSRN